MVMRLDGDIDMTTADELFDRGLAALSSHPETGRLVLDFAGVRFCDSAGMSSLVRLRQSCDERDSALRIINLQPWIHRVLVDLAGLGEYLDVADGPEPREGNDH
jgi:anti-anti-sigma factor